MKKAESIIVGGLVGLIMVLIATSFGFYLDNWQWWAIVIPGNFVLIFLYFLIKDWIKGEL